MASLIQRWIDRIDAADSQRLVLSLCLLAGAISIVRTALAYKYSLINEDGVLYLQAADFIAHGRWSEAVKLYAWPTYAAAIAAVARITGADLATAAQLIAGLCLVATSQLVLLIARACTRNNFVLVCAFLLLIANPTLNQTVGGILREHAFVACIAAAIFFYLCHVETQRYVQLGLFIVCCLAAALFRPEAMALMILIPLIDRLRPGTGWIVKALAIVAIGLFFVVAPLGLTFFGRGISYDVVADRVATIRHFGSLPLATDRARLAYAGVVIMLVLAGVVSAIGWPSLVYLAVGIRSRFEGMKPRIAWALGAIIVAAVLIGLFQVTFSLYFEGRHALPATIAAIPLAATGYAWITRWWLATAMPAWSRALLAVLAFALLAYGFVVGLPRPDAARYQLAAADWIAAEVPPDARVLSNSAQVLYYAHRPMPEAKFALALTSAMADVHGTAPDISGLQDWSKWDFLVLVLRRRDLGFVDSFARAVNGSVAQRWANSRGDEVVVFKIAHAD